MDLYNEYFNNPPAPSHRDGFTTTRGMREISFYANRGYPRCYDVWIIPFQREDGSEIRVELPVAEYPTIEEVINRGREILEEKSIIAPIIILPIKSRKHHKHDTYSSKGLCVS